MLKLWDLSCESASCAGCTDASACNYNMDATEDFSCTYPAAFLDCDGECWNDTDEDGVCDELEVLGCTEPGNPAYNPSATEDDGSCLVAGCLIPFACNYDADADYIDITLCDFSSCVGCTDPDACNYDSEATLSSAALCTFPSIPFLDCDGGCVNDTDGDGVCDEQEIPGCTDEAAVNFNPYATDDNGSCIVLVGGCVLPFACNYDSAADYYLPGSCDFSCLFGTGEMAGAGCMNELACNFGATDEPCMFFDTEGNVCVQGGCTHDAACNYDAEAVYSDGSCDFTSCAVYGCNVAGACNYDSEATQNNGTCNFTTCYGCTDSSALNFNEDASIDNGTCAIEGCTNSAACNFDASATADNGSCNFTQCYALGCTDATACNYDVEAGVNDGSCQNAADGFDCNGNCNTDSDNDGVCDAEEVDGCTDAGANNYDTAATDNDGTCTYNSYGCTNDMACNFNFQANDDDGTCEYSSCYGCMNEGACNFEAEATHPSECTYVYPMEISGSDTPVVGVEEMYTYPMTVGSEYVWTVEGGEILSGLGTSEVLVNWTEQGGSLAVKETNADGCEGFDVVIEIETVSGIVDPTAVFNIYPNPANDVVVVVSHDAVKLLTIYDATGRVVYSEQLNAGRSNIDVSGLANGAYRIVADANAGRTIQTLVISH